MSFVCHMTLQDHMIKGLSDFIEEPMKISHHAAKFGCNRHSFSKDIQVFVCDMTFRDHLTKALYDFMGRSPSK